MRIQWEDGFSIRVRVEGGAVILSANRAGLASLAGQLRTLSEAPSDTHIHYDKWNSLEEGSADLIVEKIEE